MTNKVLQVMYGKWGRLHDNHFSVKLAMLPFPSAELSFGPRISVLVIQ
jgi:hypothetical protein